MAFKQVSSQVDFPALEREILGWWYDSGVVKKYLEKNRNSSTKFSFLDGPITANNPMGVHHAWGRTYKDLWQRYHTLKGDAGRYQNGFDCQGLWVEVEVEKELGFKSKKDIEAYGIANFVNKCKERVYKYSAIQTEQTKRLGNFMDWDHSYFTMADENNYAIWNFLKVCHERGWLYKGHESIPWCPRCETAISQHEILTEDYREIAHESVYLKLPLAGRERESLLVWTTTPWTIPANIAVAVDTALDYALVNGLWVAKATIARIFGQELQPTKVVKGKQLVGWKYRGPYDHLEAVKKIANQPKFHTVVATDKRILPVNTEEGTGLVHTAVSAGQEDFKLGQKLGLPMVPVIADNADYLPGLDDLSGQNAKTNPRLVLDYLEKEDWAWKVEKYTHRYPVCWRCMTELVWKVADEWYIAMDKADPTDAKGRTLRKEMMAVAKQITWLPSFGLDRELDWLKNMHDWLISKKNRYWGLALPIYECLKCGHFEVIDGKEELHSKSVSGWEKFEGNSPHRPWVDEVKIKCSQCGENVSRILDVGNPWLDAGIVPFSTLPQGWFPADFITESFPGQFKNWFYSMIAMSTVLKKINPYKTVLGYASLLDEKGQVMHKSSGNMIEFNEGADKIGADVMRWMFVTHNPEVNLLFGYAKADETRRRFHLILWNVYNFFVTYANLDNFDPRSKTTKLSALDKWIITRLKQTSELVTKSLDKFDPYTASIGIESFVSDLSLWYVRRSRDRVGPAVVDDQDKLAFYTTSYSVLTALMRLLAPFTPYLAESIYKNLTGEESVHLADWPKLATLTDQEEELLRQMQLTRKTVELGLAGRKAAGIKVRQPLAKLMVKGETQSEELIQLIKDELNVKEVVFADGETLGVELDTHLTEELKAEGDVRELIRQVQELRKTLGAKLNQHINLTVPKIPTNSQLLTVLKRHTLADKVSEGDKLCIDLIGG